MSGFLPTALTPREKPGTPSGPSKANSAADLELKLDDDGDVRRHMSQPVTSADVVMGMGYPRSPSPLEIGALSMPLQPPVTDMLARQTSQGLLPGITRRTREPSRSSALELLRAQDYPAQPEILTNGRPVIVVEASEDDPESAVPADVTAQLGDFMAKLPLQLAVQGPECTCSSPRAGTPFNIGIASLSTGVAAAGTHNVILGALNYISNRAPYGSRLLGIRNISKKENNEFEIDPEDVKHYLNQSGSDLLPPVALAKATDRILKQLSELCTRLELDGLIFLCSPQEVSEIAKIAAHFHKKDLNTVVSGVVQSLSGWIQVGNWMPTNIGFDSACSALAEVAGNISLSREALDRDFYHFVAVGSPRLTLEVALQVRPTLCFLGVDTSFNGMTLQDIVDYIADVIISRHHRYGLHSGVIMVADDFFELLKEMMELREEIHKLRAEKTFEMSSKEGAQKLLNERKPALGRFFSMLHPDVCTTMVLRTGTDGLPMLKNTEAERELGTLVARCLSQRAEQGQISVENFTPQPISLRPLSLSPMPTPLDCSLGYCLGQISAVLCTQRVNGYAASVCNPLGPAAEWKPCCVPLSRLLEVCPTEGTLSVKKRVLNSDDPLCQLWRRVRDQWRYSQSFRQPGPVQYWGPSADRPENWATYTLRIPYTDIDKLAAELEDEDRSGPATHIEVPYKRPSCGPYWLMRRKMCLLSPLQKWRCEYQPNLPKVFRAPYRVVEEDRKGRVCADLRKVHTHFPNLLRIEALKAVKIVESVKESVNVMHMLPDQPTRPLHVIKDQIWAGSSGSLEASDSDKAPNSPKDKLPSPRSVEHKMVEPPRERGNSGQPFEMDFEMCLASHMKKVGIALIGKPGPGVNNVIKGLYDYMKCSSGSLVGITMGIAGLVNGHAIELDEESLFPHYNQGGSDLLGQSMPEDLQHLGEDFPAIVNTARKLELDGLVIWGGRKVHTWTARLSEYFAEHQPQTPVIAVPASTQSDLPLVEQTIGYDTICKLFSSIVGNLATQAASSGKLWCFARIPGRSISHIAAEVALETHPHVVLMFEDMDTGQHLSLAEVTQMICNIIEARSSMGMNYGVVLIPDQFLASVHQMRQLFEEVEQIWRSCPEALEQSVARDFGLVMSLLPPLSRALFQSLPERTRGEICGVVLDACRRCFSEEEIEAGVCINAHRKVELDLGKVETEVILQTLVETELTRRVVLGTYKGPFQAMTYSMPYHGRAAMPTNFDCDLGYTIGYASGVLVDTKCTGLLVDVRLLKEDTDHWEVGGTPLSSLVTFRDDKEKYHSHARKDGIRRFSKTQHRHQNPYEIQPRHRLLYDLGYEKNMPDPCERTLVSPGPCQFAGPCSDTKTQTLCMPQLQRIRQMARTEKLITELRAKARAGCPPEVLQAVKMLLQGGVELLKQF